MKNGSHGPDGALPGLFLMGAALWLRHLLAGWLLPAGTFLEELVPCISGGGASVAQSVFSEVGRWILQ